jgi:hypothetical protein
MRTADSFEVCNAAYGQRCASRWAFADLIEADLIENAGVEREAARAFETVSHCPLQFGARACLLIS